MPQQICGSRWRDRIVRWISTGVKLGRVASGTRLKGKAVRIISDFHDYYDSVQATGQDQTLVYLRARNEAELNRSTYQFPLFGGISPYYEFRPRGMPIVQIVVGFCGKVYPILRLSHQRQPERSPDIALCYTVRDVDAFIEGHFRRREIETYRSKPRRWRFQNSLWPRGQRREKFEEFFAAFAEKRSAFGQIFLDNRCPIFVASTWWDTEKGRKFKIVYNECLKELEFFRVMDTFTAYQELQMYFGAMAQPNKPIPAVSDKDMVSIKGFDEWSFRKPPKSYG